MRISERVDNAVRFMVELAAGDLADIDGGAIKAEPIASRQGISLKYLLPDFEAAGGRVLHTGRWPTRALTCRGVGLP